MHADRSGGRRSLVAQADIGGFGVGSDFAWQATAFANWQLSEHVNIGLGLRCLGVDDEDATDNGRCLYDMTLGGPDAAFAWRFRAS
jgi:hypothetical protein